MCKRVRVCLQLMVQCTRVCRFLFQAEDGIRYLVRSRGLGDVYKRQAYGLCGRRKGEIQLIVKKIKYFFYSLRSDRAGLVLSLIHI